MENVTAAEIPAEHESPRGKIVTLFVQGSLLVGEAVALIWLAERVLSAEWVQAACLGQFLLAMSAASGLSFDPNAAGGVEQLKLQDLADQRSKALEVLANVMQVVGEVDKTILDNLN